MNYYLKNLSLRHLLPDTVLVAASLYLSLYLRVGTEGWNTHLPTLQRYIAIFIVLKIAVFISTGLYNIIWRYVSVRDAIALIRSVSLATLLIISATYLFDMGRIPRSTYFIDAILVTLLLGAARLGRRLIHEAKHGKDKRSPGYRTLIYGAGTNGRALAQRFAHEQVGFRHVGFIDDDPKKIGRIVNGTKVWGGIDALEGIIKTTRAREVVISIPNPSAQLLKRVTEVCRHFNIRPTLTSSTRRLSRSADDGKISMFRKLELGDLLNRDKRNIDLSGTKAIVEDKVVMITGAGGSIGKELARQINDLSPKKLLLVDNSEFSLYQVDQELRDGDIEFSKIVPILVDITDHNLLRHTFEQFKPEIVFHAAAYKHVHLVEQNPFSAILNNIEGTKNLVELSLTHSVERFVLISTDKAVNPVGIMGATKRLCEMIVAKAGKESGRIFCAVRFGNVLGSSGSLIPKLQQQIEQGAAITITHKEMTRYFMLLPEAVSLVLRAAHIAKPSEIMVLRMGEPVKIVDIAKNLILLMGKTEEEIPIIFTQPRPGEKLFEELYLCGNELQTEDPDILILNNGDCSELDSSLSYQLLLNRVNKLLDKALANDKSAVDDLGQLVNPDSWINNLKKIGNSA